MRFDFHAKMPANAKRLQEELTSRGGSCAIACNGDGSDTDPFTYADGCLECDEAEAVKIGEQCNASVYQHNPHRVVRHAQ